MFLAETFMTIMKEDRLNKIKSFLEETPNEPFLLYALAKEYEKLGEELSAIKAFEHLVENHPEYAGTYYHLGKAYERANEFEKALKIYDKGIAITKKIGDKHALGELSAAKLMIE